MPEKPISKSQANQRSGRAGRTEKGVCYRLYKLAEYDRFQEHQTPEIKRENLADSLLQLCALGVTDFDRFPFLDQPPIGSLNAALVQLRNLDAIQEKTNLMTNLGHKVII